MSKWSNLERDLFTYMSVLSVSCIVPCILTFISMFIPAASFPSRVLFSEPFFSSKASMSIPDLWFLFFSELFWMRKPGSNRAPPSSNRAPPSFNRAPLSSNRAPSTSSVSRGWRFKSGPGTMSKSTIRSVLTSIGTDGDGSTSRPRSKPGNGDATSGRRADPSDSPPEDPKPEDPRPDCPDFPDFAASGFPTPGDASATRDTEGARAKPGAAASATRNGRSGARETRALTARHGTSMALNAGATVSSRTAPAACAA
ncbi:predicted protein [Clavispora lusitaniae ATCC 42720]|uniref:Uncharacterized protein n=1 Tax=Clavispora lusitaniae (strain ATCC 42720) TaxID=306902 RepID=C4Y4X8_CLAL4|nr:uncharacterized protein CLUG_03212 [Clavispora lusitaniae ATCC 42720]EEQ39083.1 predicted protein [Clavispora lusitaniae ATCC 42720]